MKKRNIILISILTIVIIIIVFGCIYLYRQSKTHLLIAPNTDLECHFNKCEVIKITSNTREKYDVYKENNLLGNYNLKQYKNKWYIYDYNYEFIDHGDDVIAFEKGCKAKLIKFDILDFSSEDDKILEQILKEENINNTTNSIANKIEMDFDDDSQKEQLYVVSNVMSNDSSTKAYSLVYLNDGGKIKFLEKIIEPKSKELLINKYTLKAIIDLNDDKKYEIILNSNNIDNCYSVYKRSFGRYKTVVACNSD